VWKVLLAKEEGRLRTIEAEEAHKAHRRKLERHLDRGLEKGEGEPVVDEDADTTKLKKLEDATNAAEEKYWELVETRLGDKAPLRSSLQPPGGRNSLELFEKKIKYEEHCMQAKIVQLRKEYKSIKGTSTPESDPIATQKLDPVQALKAWREVVRVAKEKSCIEVVIDVQMRSYCKLRAERLEGLTTQWPCKQKSYPKFDHAAIEKGYQTWKSRQGQCGFPKVDCGAQSVIAALRKGLINPENLMSVEDLKNVKRFWEEKTKDEKNVESDINVQKMVYRDAKRLEDLPASEYPVRTKCEDPSKCLVEWKKEAQRAALLFSIQQQRAGP